MKYIHEVVVIKCMHEASKYRWRLLTTVMECMRLLTIVMESTYEAINHMASYTASNHHSLKKGF